MTAFTTAHSGDQPIQSRIPRAIPLSFVLAQIEGLNVTEAYEQLKGWYKTLLWRRLMNDCRPMALTERIHLTLTDMQHLFANNQEELVTPYGIRLIDGLLSHRLLDAYSPSCRLPDSLKEYSTLQIPIEDIDHAEQLVPALNHAPETYAYSELYYLFDAFHGQKLGEVKLTVGGRAVTRLTEQKINPDSSQSEYETKFIWENDACRTQYLTRLDANPLAVDTPRR